MEKESIVTDKGAQVATPKKELTDYDLDVMNSLKDFPESPNDGVIYLRGGTDKITNKTKTPFVWVKGSANSHVASLIPILFSVPFLRNVILQAVLNYLNSDQVAAKDFVSNVKTSKIDLIR